MSNRIHIVFTDLDGTLLTSEKKLSRANLQCLEELQREKITRVIATGRSYYSFSTGLATKIPADYLIFSTGAGIMDLTSDQLLYSANLNRKDIYYITRHLQQNNIDFMVHHAVPENHYFTYSGLPEKNSDFSKRISIYNNFAKKFSSYDALPESGAQIIAILPENLDLFEYIQEGLSDYQITRTTSPFDHKSIWMEISPAHASKGHSAAWLCDYLDIAPSTTFGIGNDYNDISLLNFTRYSYLVANAPTDLQKRFPITNSNNDDGFYHAVRNALNSGM
ncbi:MAG: HAD family hydrolase [Desulfocapsaceae bacterium]|nr:HAD family hydrolase [Desulfocapsaceae bacterium]